MLKRMGALLLCLVLLCPAALAEYPVFEIASIVTGFYGEQARINYFRCRNSAEGQLAVLDEQGRELKAITVPPDREYGTIWLPTDNSFPLSQTLRVVFRTNGKETVQGECLLALDDQREGISKVDTQEKKIAITFDSSNGAGKTEELLELLALYNAHCTFFLQGVFVVENPELVSAIDAGGHEIGNHTMNHPDMTAIENEKIYSQLTRANAEIEAVTGKPAVLYRPPSGYYTFRDRAIARALGCEMILWTFDSLDGFKEVSQEQIMSVMWNHSEPGAIILMHVYGRKTLAVLSEYLPMMRAQGYSFVTVSELLRIGENENGL